MQVPSFPREPVCSIHAGCSNRDDGCVERCLDGAFNASVPTVTKRASLVAACEFQIGDGAPEPLKPVHARFC